MARLGLAALTVALLAPSADVALAAGPPHVMMVLLENYSYEQVVGNSNMPFVNELLSANGSVSTTGLSHPSRILGATIGAIDQMAIARAGSFSWSAWWRRGESNP